MMLCVMAANGENIVVTPKEDHKRIEDSAGMAQRVNPS